MKHNSVSSLLSSAPLSYALMRGNKTAPHLSGTVKFYPWSDGTIVKAELVNLPLQSLPFAFHIHEGESCTPEDFGNTKGHYNPTGALHPAHAGDMPVLFSNNGYCYSVFYTNRFKPCEIIGRTVVIHSQPDDFRTQPAGNSGIKIGCGKILGYRCGQ